MIQHRAAMREHPAYAHIIAVPGDPARRRFTARHVGFVIKGRKVYKRP